MTRHLFSSPNIGTMLIAVIAAATLSHKYAPNSCMLFECNAVALMSIKVVTLAGMVAANGALLFLVFKYRNSYNSAIRGKVALMVVFVACTHMIIHNLCHAFFGGICGRIPDLFTLVFLMLVIGVVGVVPRVLWSAGMNDAVEGPKTTNREYYKTKIDDRYFIWAYWSYVVASICFIYVFDIAGWFFEPEILISLLVGLFGPFIALWFANHERNKRIMENHVYKVDVLFHINAILHTTVLHFQQLQPASPNERDGVLDGDKDDRTVRNALSLEYQYRKGHVERLNTNTYIPVDTRYIITDLVRMLDRILTQYRPLHAFDNPDMDKEHLLKTLDTLGRHKYFTDDRDPDVRYVWGHVKHGICDTQEEVAKLP